MAVRGRRGYTLTETMITVAIVGILAGVAAPLMINMVNFWRQTTARNDIERDVRASLSIMNRFLRQAKKGTVKIDRFDSSQPPWSRISFTTISDDQLRFYQDANELFMVLKSSGSSVSVTSRLSERVGYIAFTYPQTRDPTIVSVAVTMQAPTYLGGKKALQLSIQKVRIMN